MSAGSYTLGELAEVLAVECKGNSAQTIKGMATLSGAGDQQLSFLANPKYKPELVSTEAAAVILDPITAADFAGNCLISDNPYLTYAKASRLFEPARDQGGIHPNASVSPTAKIDKSVSISAGCVVGENVEIAADTRLGPGTVVGDNCVIGQGCLLHANVTLYHNVRLGDGVIIQSGAVLGSDGFGFAPDPQADIKWVKIAQLGGVTIGNAVEIGACTTIDRGAIEDTVIEDGVILDNHIQIAHNVHIGQNTAIAAFTGIAGSSKIGKNCTLAGRVSIVGHISICDNTHVSMCGEITKSITTPGSYSSGTGMQETSQWRKNTVRLSQLDEITKRLIKLEKQQK